MKGLVIYANRLNRRDNDLRFEAHDFYDDPLFLRLSEAVSGHIEIGRPAGLPDPFIMIVNEEGLLLGLALNSIASILYGVMQHGQPIVGNVVIMKEGIVDGEPDIVGLDPEDIKAVSYIIELCQKLCNMFTVEFGEADDDGNE